MSGFYENINDALPDIKKVKEIKKELISKGCLLYTSPSPRD